VTAGVYVLAPTILDRSGGNFKLIAGFSVGCFPFVTTPDPARSAWRQPKIMPSRFPSAMASVGLSRRMDVPENLGYKFFQFLEGSSKKSQDECFPVDSDSVDGVVSRDLLAFHTQCVARGTTRSRRTLLKILH